MATLVCRNLTYSSPQPSFCQPVLGGMQGRMTCISLLLNWAANTNPQLQETSSPRELRLGTLHQYIAAIIFFMGKVRHGY